MVAIQIRDVPDDVRDALARAAKEEGQSLQAYLLDLLTREARFERNLAWLDDLEAHKGQMASGGAHGAELIREARREAGRE